MSKHTSGPWKDTGLPSEYGKIVIAADGPEVVCEIPLDSKRAAGNYSLIAAAPDLLEAAEAAFKAVDDMSFTPVCMIEALDKLRAAIAKAKGETV